jgi:hypothetical protein
MIPRYGNCAVARFVMRQGDDNMYKCASSSWVFGQYLLSQNEFAHFSLP